MGLIAFYLASVADLSVPNWEAGGQFSLVAAGGDLAIRMQIVGGHLWGPHELELHAGLTRVHAATLSDVDGSYALHYVRGLWMMFARVGVGARFEHVGGGGRRSRWSVLAGAGVKLRASETLALRTDIEYRHLGGAPGVADEFAILVGPVALW